MLKDFTKWNNLKQELHEQKGAKFFHEREIWWCSLGVNIGFEQDGRGESFERPIVIMKKFNLDTFLGLPLTTSKKSGKYYFEMGEVEGREAVAVLSQMRFLDRKCLANKIAVVDIEKWKELQSAVIASNFEKPI